MGNLPVRTALALAQVESAIGAAWDQYRRENPDANETELASRVAEEPNRHDWRLVDAALDRLNCPECSSSLGRGPRGCASCDFADGFRFAGREIDRPGVPPGNDHAIRVSSAVLRAPHRYPNAAVKGNELFLPLFLEGQMPTREQQERFDAALRRGQPARTDLTRAGTFAELVEMATARSRKVPGGSTRGV